MRTAIPFYIPFIHKAAKENLHKAIEKNQLKSNGPYTAACKEILQKKFGLQHTFLTPSATNALELLSLVINIKPGDEVIVPSFAHSSCANPFISRGAKIKLADSRQATPHIDPKDVEKKITDHTKLVLTVHYGGTPSQLSALKDITRSLNCYLVEDAAHALGANYDGAPIGTLGDFSIFSFHHTKNLPIGEGGLLVINNKKWLTKAEETADMGTNRQAFIRGRVPYYEWTRPGSSNRLAELSAALLNGQLKHSKSILQQFQKKWQYYFQKLKPLTHKVPFQLPTLPNETANHNHYLFYLKFKNKEQRERLRTELVKFNIQTAFHYVPLHLSKFFQTHFEDTNLPNAKSWFETLLRFPLYPDLSKQEIDHIVSSIKQVYNLQ